NFRSEIMLIKPRTKSINYLILESLSYRMNLYNEDKRRYQNQIKEFQGELLFDQFINRSQQSGFIVNDLFLSSKDTNYQVDSILVLINSCLFMKSKITQVNIVMKMIPFF